MAVEQVSLYPLGRGKVEIVLVGWIEQQILIFRMEAHQSQSHPVVQRHRDLTQAAPQLTAVMGQQRRRRGSRVSRIGGRWSIDRVRIQPAGDVHRRYQPDPSDQGTASLGDKTVEPVVPTAAEGTVCLISHSAFPVSGWLFRDHVDEAGDGLTVPGRKAIGHQRCFAQDIWRNREPQSAAGSIELILDPHSIQNEGLLAEAPATVALAHATGRQSHRLLERADRQFPQVGRGDLLLRGRGQRIEHRVHRCRHHQRLQLQGIGLQREIDRHGSAGLHEDAVPDDASVADRPRRQAVPPTSNAANPVDAAGIADRANPLIHQNLGLGQGPIGAALIHSPRDGALSLSSECRRQ